MVGATIYLEEVAGRLRAEGLQVEAVVRQGGAASAILAEAEATGADLLLVATEVRDGLARLVLGSVADELLRRAPCPVLFVRTEAPGGAPAGQAPAQLRRRPGAGRGGDARAPGAARGAHRPHRGQRGPGP